MSIIYDALQKTQKNRKLNATQSTVLQKKLNRNIVGLKSGLLLTAMLLIITIFTYYPRVNFRAPAPTNTVAVHTPSAVLVPKLMIERKLALKGIFIAEKNRLAIINGQRLHVGDKVDDMRLVRIEKNHVILKNQQETIRLTMN